MKGSKTSLRKEVNRVMKTVIPLKNRAMVKINGQIILLSVEAAKTLEDLITEVKVKVRSLVKQFLTTGGVVAQ